MENISGRPGRAAAQADLDAVDEVQRAVRDTPWPGWLYPANAALLGLLALSMLLDGSARPVAVVGLSLTTALLNTAVGQRIGTPWVVPTSPAFRTGIAVAALSLGAAFLVGDLGGADARLWVVLLAVLTAGSYLAGSLPRMRSASR